MDSQTENLVEKIENALKNPTSFEFCNCSCGISIPTASPSISMARSSHLPLPLSIFLLSFLFFFFFLCLSCNALSPDRKSNFPSSDRTLLSLQRRRDQQISNCGEKVSALQCSQTPKCRWCRSDVIDDTCFTRAEALRLPQQVFSCD